MPAVTAATLASPDKAEAGDRDYVNSLARGLDVIRAFTRVRPQMTLSEVAERTGMNRAAARRFLLTLVREGYCDTNGRNFRLTPKVLELGFSLIASLDISEVMGPVLGQLSERLQESCFAVILDGDAVVYVARASARPVLNVGISIGTRVAAHCMSSGRVLLGALPDDELDARLAALKPQKLTPNTVTSRARLRKLIEDARRDGYAMVDQEYEIGFRSISVPVRDRTGQCVAAINVTCPTPRVSLESMRTEFLMELRRAAAQVSQSLPG